MLQLPMDVFSAFMECGRLQSTLCSFCRDCLLNGKLDFLQHRAQRSVCFKKQCIKNDIGDAIVGVGGLGQSYRVSAHMNNM